MAKMVMNAKATKKTVAKEVKKEEVKKEVKVLSKTLADGVVIKDSKYKGKECQHYARTLNGVYDLAANLFENKALVYSANEIKEFGSPRMSKGANEPRPYQYHVTREMFDKVVLGK